MVKTNKFIKIITILLIAICLTTSITRVVDAAITDDITVTASEVSDAKDKITGISGNVLWIIQAAGFVAGIIILAYMGIKYITASPDGKAEIKKQAVIYVGGAALIMLAPTIAKWIFNAVN